MTFLVPRAIAEMARLKEAALNTSGGTAMVIDERSEWEAVEHCIPNRLRLTVKVKRRDAYGDPMMVFYDSFCFESMFLEI